MFLRRPFQFVSSILFTVLVAGACSESPLAPTGPGPLALDQSVGSLDGTSTSGSSSFSGPSGALPRVAVCVPRGPLAASATIGPVGGVLRVGSSWLVVPPGALEQHTLISGTTGPEAQASVHFEPSGLRFKRPARLLLDANGCSISTSAPSVLYLEPDGSVAERIEATYLRFLGWVAAPINHFSAYAIGV